MGSFQFEHHSRIYSKETGHSLFCLLPLLFSLPAPGFGHGPVFFFRVQGGGGQDGYRRGGGFGRGGGGD